MPDTCVASAQFVFGMALITRSNDDCLLPVPGAQVFWVNHELYDTFEAYRIVISKLQKQLAVLHRFQLVLESQSDTKNLMRAGPVLTRAAVGKFGAEVNRGNGKITFLLGLRRRLLFRDFPDFEIITCYPARARPQRVYFAYEE